MGSSFWKYMLLFLAFLMAVVLFMWPSANDSRLKIDSPFDSTTEEQLKTTTVEDVGTSSMIKPRFSGEDDKNRSWEISAEEAKQSSPLNPENIWLDDVKAKAQNEKGQEISFEAGEGTYEKEGSKLLLKEGVSVQGYGFTLQTEALESNLDDRTAQGQGGVSIAGEGATLEAKEFKIDDHGTNIHLGGGVKGRFYPDQMRENIARQKEEAAQKVKERASE